MERISWSSLDTLCAYFGVGTIGDVLQYVSGLRAVGDRAESLRLVTYTIRRCNRVVA